MDMDVLTEHLRWGELMIAMIRPTREAARPTICYPYRDLLHREESASVEVWAENHAKDASRSLSICCRLLVAQM